MRFFVLSLIVFGSAWAGGKSPAAGATTHTVVIEGMKFTPETLTIQPGDTVMWVNKDIFPHTATFKGAFDSGVIAAGSSWKHQFRLPGDFNYGCTLHPPMKARLTVAK